MWIRIRIRQLRLMRIWIQDYDDQKFYNFTAEKSNFFVKDVQATGEAFSPPKRTSSISKQEISYLFSIFVGNFCLLGYGSGSSRPIYMRIRIWIHNTGFNGTGMVIKLAYNRGFLWISAVVCGVPYGSLLCDEFGDLSRS